MLSIAITIAAVAFVVSAMLRTNRKRYGSYWGWGEIGFAAALAGVTAFGLAVVISVALAALMDNGSYRITEQDQGRIVSINDVVGSGGEFSGSFFLGIGDVAGKFGPEITYTFYEEVEGGDLRGRVVAEDGYNAVYVRERNGIKPHYSYVASEDPCHTPAWLNPIHQLCAPETNQVEWVIVVPRDTVLHGYSLDAR